MLNNYKPYESLIPETTTLLEDITKKFACLGDRFTAEEKKALSAETYQQFPTIDLSPRDLFNVIDQISDIAREIYTKRAINSENELEKMAFITDCMLYSNYTAILLGIKILINEFGKMEEYQTDGRIPLVFGFTIGLMLKSSSSTEFICKLSPNFKEYSEKLYHIFQTYEKMD
ncbi:MAG: hypothetical protein Q4D02_07395 [Clostridia bacterium]|nr:hypothetical protein [Clostridia bacterium]